MKEKWFQYKHNMSGEIVTSYGTQMNIDNCAADGFPAFDIVELGEFTMEEGRKNFTAG